MTASEMGTVQNKSISTRYWLKSITVPVWYSVWYFAK